jgi:hypothetical protein
LRFLLLILPALAACHAILPLDPGDDTDPSTDAPLTEEAAVDLSELDSAASDAALPDGGFASWWDPAWIVH